MTEPEEQKEQTGTEKQEDSSERQEESESTQKSEKPKEQNKVRNGKSLGKTIDKWGKMTMLGVGVCYGLGLLVSNSYLAKFGILEFSALRVQYIVVGATFIVVLAIPAIVLALPWIVATQFHRAYPQKEENPPTRLPFKIGRLWKPIIIYVIFLCFLFEMFVITATVPFPEHAESFMTTLYATGKFYGRDILGILVIYAAVAATLLPLFSPALRLDRERVKLFTLFGLVCTICGLCIYTISYVDQPGLYSRLTPSLGGGRRVPICILPDNSAAGPLDKLGLDTDTSHGFIRAELLHESSDAYFLLPPDTTGDAKCIRLPKSLTRGVVYLKHEFALGVDDDELITDSAADSMVLRDSLPDPDSAEVTASPTLSPP